MSGNLLFYCFQKLNNPLRAVPENSMRGVGGNGSQPPLPPGQKVLSNFILFVIPSFEIVFHASDIGLLLENDFDKNMMKV